MQRNLKFNPNYYRIWTPEELDAAELEELGGEDYDLDDGEEEKKGEDADNSGAARKSLNARRSSERMRGSMPRKVSQAKLQFPATLDQVKDDLLAEVNEDMDESGYSV